MEDILASIRRNLSEDDQEEGAEAAAPEAEPAPEPEPEPEPEQEPEPEPVMEMEPEPASPPEPGLEDVLDLTPAMIAGDQAVSDPAARASSDALQELARLLLSQRDIAIGSRDITLEGLLREILRPLLREWLDRNLPYLIEELVNKEISHKVNRAEPLDN